MDIDTVIEDLHAVMKYTREGTFEDAVGQASNLLRLARYRTAEGEPHSLLASDIKAAIARLPAEVQRDANGLLPIDEPGSYLDARWRAIGAANFPGQAKEWRWRSVLGRVAVELLTLHARETNGGVQRSIRIQSLHVFVRLVYDSEVRPDVVSRIVIFHWGVESQVSDMQWFAFPFSTRSFVVRNLVVSLTEVPSAGPTVIRVPVSESSDADNYWYVCLLRGPLPVAQPVDLGFSMACDETSSSPPWFEYTLQVPVEQLTLTVQGHRATTEYALSEREAGTDRIIREEAAFSKAADGQPPLVRYEPPSPEVGHTYRVAWPFFER
jgi:hypothetical protein